jgi:hypothetical protein
MAEKKKTSAKSKPTAPKAVDLATEEKRLADKYPKRSIVKGSIRDAGTIEEFGNKRTVEIKCDGPGKDNKGCKATRRVATSDLHQVSKCTDCIHQVRLDRRKDARAKPTKPKPAKSVKSVKSGTVKEGTAKTKTKPVKEAVKEAVKEKKAPPKPMRGRKSKPAPEHTRAAQAETRSETRSEEMAEVEQPTADETDDLLEQQIAQSDA